MIYGNIQYLKTAAILEQLELWQEAFEWLRELNVNSPLGIAERYDGKMSLNVHTYQTKPRSECRYENHNYTIDIQYTIAGGEYIEWSISDSLTPDGDYVSDRDKQYFLVPPTSNATLIHMPAQHFAVFMPDDAHCPKIHDRLNDHILKAVVKIDTSLLH